MAGRRKEERVSGVFLVFIVDFNFLIFRKFLERIRGIERCVLGF